MPQRPSITLLGCALVAGCATVPDLGVRPQPKGAMQLESSRTISGGVSKWPADHWWDSYGDAQLARLIEEALANNPDVAAAAARVRAADALVRQAGAGTGPTLSVDGLAGGNKQSESLGIPPQFIPGGIRDTGRLSATFGFNLDLWGRERAALAAATSEADAARVDAAQAVLMLSTTIASAYAELAQYHLERDVAVSALAVREATARLTAQRVTVGVDARGSLRQAEARVPAARADMVALDEAITLTRNRLAALVGAGPDRGLAIARPTLRSSEAGVPASAGIDLAGRRPDIVAARLRAEAAAKRIKVARADFYPNLNLTAIAGLQSLGLGQLLKGASSYGTGGLAFSLPIFDGGRIAGRYRQAGANYDEAVARYDGLLTGALRDVADAIASGAATERRLAEQKQALGAAEDAARIARLRYEGGLSSLLPVLTAEDTMLASRRAVADLEARRIALDIVLIRALGGGYRSTQISQEHQ